MVDKIAAVLVAAAILVYPYAGQIEGRLFPVVKGFIIDRSESDGEGGTRIWGELNLRRENCSFIATEWYLDGATRSIALSPPVYEEGPKLRAEGISSFGPWVLDAPSQSLGQIRGVSIHQCPWRPWRTVTAFYP